MMENQQRASAITIATTKARKAKIVSEDITIDTAQISWPLVPAERKVLTFTLGNRS